MDELQQDVDALKRYHIYEKAMAWCRENGAGYKAGYREFQGAHEKFTLKGLRDRLAVAVLWPLFD